MSYGWSRPTVAHTGGYLILKMEASRDALHAFGNQFPKNRGFIFGAVSVLNHRYVATYIRRYFCNLSEVGFDPVTSMFKIR